MQQTILLKESKNEDNLKVVKASSIYEFKGILDISLSNRIDYEISQYYAQIASLSKIPAVLSTFYTFASILQVAGLGFFISDTDTWDPNSPETIVVKILSVFWAGLSGFGYIPGVLGGVIASIIILIVYLFIILRAHEYVKTKRLYENEPTVVSIITKYLIKFLLPFMACAIPLPVTEIKRGNNIALQLLIMVVCIIGICVGSAGYYNFFCIRLNFDENILHEWGPLESILLYVFLLYSDLFVSVNYVDNGIIGTIFIAVFMIISIINTAYDLTHPFIYVKGNIIHASSCMTSFCAAVLHLIRQKSEFSNIITIVISILLFVLFYFGFSLLKNWSIGTRIAFLDQCSELRESGELEDFLKNKFKSAFHLSSVLRATFETGHPFLFTWEIFDYGFNNFPKDSSILLTYLRIVALFPSCTERLMNLSERISITRVSNKVLLNMVVNNLIQQRSNLLNPAISAELDSIELMEESYYTIRENFWECVLHGQTDSFWPEVNAVNASVNEIRMRYSQLLTNYPNCPECWSRFAEFSMDIAKDASTTVGVQRTLQRIEETTRAQPDHTLEMGKQCFPAINNFGDLLDDSLEPVYNRDFVGFDQNDITNVEVLQDLTDNTKLAGFGWTVLFMIVMQAVVVGITVIFLVKFRTDVVDVIKSSLDCFKYANDIMYSISHYCLQVTTKHYLDIGMMSATDDTMNTFAKYTYKNGHVNMLRCDDTNISFMRNAIQGLIQSLTESLLDLSSVPVFQTLSNQLNTEEFKNTGVPLLTYIMSVISESEGDEDLFHKTRDIFDRLKNITEAAANNFNVETMSSNLTSISIIIICIEVCLVIFPYILKLFVISKQKEMIAKEFMRLPVAELQGLAGGEIESRGGSMMIVGGNSYSYAGFMHFSFAMLLLPVLVLLIITNFLASSYIENQSHVATSIAFLKTTHGSARLGLVAEIHQFYYYRIENDAAKADKIAEEKNALIARSKLENTNSLVLAAKQVAAWLEIEPEYVYNESELADNDHHIPATTQMFDRVTSQYFTHAHDNMLFFVGVGSPEGAYAMGWLYAHVYWFLQYTMEHRDQPFFGIIIRKMEEELSSTENVATAIISVLIVCEIVSILITIMYFVKQREQIKEALWLIRYINVSTVLKATTLLELITDAKLFPEEEKQAFQSADMILDKTQTVVILANRHLNIVDLNTAAVNLLGREAIGRNLKDLFPKEGDWNDVVLHIHEAVTGKGTSSFSQTMWVTHKGDERCFEFSLSSLCDDHIALEGEAGDIKTLVISLQDKTATMNDIRAIEREGMETNNLLKKVMASQIVEQLMSGEDTVAWVTQSVTLGDIRVGADRRFDYISDEPHAFFKKVYDRLDAIMENYPLLARVRTFAHGYTFVGGLFSTVNKPDRHAEEAVRFSLAVIQELPKISQEVGAHVNVIIGVHTGGPVIAGCMSMRRPSLQIIGDCGDFAFAMKNTGDTNAVHVTRSVYELIYTSGFNVSDAGDCQISPTLTVPTYVIRPWN